MNKKGAAVFVVLMIGIICFVLGMALAPPLKIVLEESMNQDELNCSNPSISQMKHAVCTQIDMFLPLFVGLLFGLAGMLIAGIALQ